MHPEKYLFEHSSRENTIRSVRNHSNETTELYELPLSGAHIYWKIYRNTHTKLHSYLQVKWYRNIFVNM